MAPGEKHRTRTRRTVVRTGIRWTVVRVRAACGLLALLVLGVLLLSGPGQAQVKTVLLIAQVLPPIPLKPLDLLTAPPAHTRITLASPNGPIVADLFRPVPRLGGVAPHSEPAVILAMGVKTTESDKAQLLGFAAILSRLGYVVLWPRLAAIDRGADRLESPATFVVAARYLSRLPAVASQRLSLFGLSVGASLAFVAATDRWMQSHVRAVIFFGGYEDIFDYLVSLATHTSQLGGRVTAWHPDPQAILYARKLVRTSGAGDLLRLFTARSRAQAWALLRAAPARQLATLHRLSPSAHLAAFRARIFILHDQGDTFVPAAQAALLDRALPARVARTYLLSDLFAHTHPMGGVSWAFVTGALQLYGFVQDAFATL